MLAMQHVLVINPNTSPSVTERLLMQLSIALPNVQMQGATAAFGAPYIADEYSYCVAGHAVLDAWEQARPLAGPAGFSAAVVGCFGDPGLEALREVAGVPVLGLAQASVQAMADKGFARIGIVTGGAKWKPMLERWSRAKGYGGAGARAAAKPVHIASIEALPITGMHIMQSPQTSAHALAQACTHMLQHTPHLQAVLLGGAGLAGMGARVRALTGLPVWDCVEAVETRLQQALERAAQH